jgi:hypothetical protein
MRCVNSFDPDRFRLRSVAGGSPPANTRIPRPVHGERFLRGPISWAWLALCAPLPGRAMQVGIGIWFWVGVMKCATIRLSVSQLASDFSISRAATYRGLESLERAGLVAIERHRGRRPIVTVLAAPSEVGVKADRAVMPPEQSTVSVHVTEGDPGAPRA